MCELNEAENFLIKSTQYKFFNRDYTSLKKNNTLTHGSKLACLYLTLDECGLRRSQRRLKNADFLPYEVKYPIILPRNSWLTKLVIRHYHVLGNHRAGTNHT